jgi:hypothetical protein
MDQVTKEPDVAICVRVPRELEIRVLKLQAKQQTITLRRVTLTKIMCDALRRYCDTYQI